MKVCTLDVQFVDGSLGSIPFPDSGSAMKLAKDVRASGKLEGEPVRCGMVRASWDSFARFKFVCKAESVVEVEDQPKARPPRKK